MIDANAGIALESVSQIFPKGKNLCLWVHFAEGIDAKITGTFV